MVWLMSNNQLFPYQADVEQYVVKARVPYDSCIKGIRDHLGGLKGKVLLDLGVGFQLPHGGLTLALAIQDGASRCFGIDIAHPELHSIDPAKLAFWQQARKSLAIDVQGLEEGRVVFASTDILHFDEFFSKITLLQMSASDMWFKDEMFDVVISNAVFEHVQKPKEVLSELFRILKPGGGAAINWNPFAGLRMGGHDIGLPYYYPWAHLRLCKDEHIEKLRTVFSTPELYKTAFPPEHTPTDERASVYRKDPELFLSQMSYGLNKLRIAEFLSYAEAVGFKIMLSEPVIFDEDRKYLTDEIRSELGAYTEEELLQVLHRCVLRKSV